MQHIDIYNAWEVAKDKTGVVVGIVDSGTDLEHPDLIGNVWLNTKETINNKDDDGNGYIDDIHGWDFAGDVTYNQAAQGQLKPDNNPTPDYIKYPNTTNTHGTHVTGLIAAVANNAKNGAGTGINAKFVATKHSTDDGSMDILQKLIKELCIVLKLVQK